MKKKLMMCLGVLVLIVLVSSASQEVQARATGSIEIGTAYIEIPWNESSSFGFVRNQGISDIIITEIRYGALQVGNTIWLGVEGGISRGWGVADHISLSAGNVSIIGCDVMEISAPRIDSHGVSIQIIRASRNPDVQIVFSDVKISGFVFPGQSYYLIVAGDGIADNWGGFHWYGRRPRGVHGFFDREPFSIRAFSFVDAESIVPELY